MVGFTHARGDSEQIEIVRTLRVDRSFVNNIENGKNNTTLSTIASLAKALGVSTTELLNNYGKQ